MRTACAHGLPGFGQTAVRVFCAELSGQIWQNFAAKIACDLQIWVLALADTCPKSRQLCAHTCLAKSGKVRARRAQHREGSERKACFLVFSLSPSSFSVGNGSLQSPSSPLHVAYDLKFSAESPSEMGGKMSAREAFRDTLIALNALLCFLGLTR